MELDRETTNWAEAGATSLLTKFTSWGSLWFWFWLGLFFPHNKITRACQRLFQFPSPLGASSGATKVQTKKLESSILSWLVGRKIKNEGHYELLELQ